MTKSRKTASAVLLVINLVVMSAVSAGPAIAHDDEDDHEEGSCVLEISKTVDSVTAEPGQILTYTINFKNTGTADCTGGGVKVVDTVSEHLDFQSAENSGNVDPGYWDVPLYDANTRTLNWNAHELIPGEEGFVKWTAEIKIPENCGDFSIPNTAKITARELDNFQTWVESNTVTTEVNFPCDEPEHDTTIGQINICKIIVDANGNIVDGSAVAGAKFGISWMDTTSEEGGVAALPVPGNTEFSAVLALNADLVNDNGDVNDAQCVTIDGLELGHYFYSAETITPAANEIWSAPKYSDGYSGSIDELSDLLLYFPQLFDNINGNAEERNLDADGDIVLSADRPERTLVIMNQYSAAVNHPASNVPTECPLVGASGRTIVDFQQSGNYSVMLSHGTAQQAEQGPFVVSLADGLYDVTQVSFDNHSGHGGQGQPQESYYLELRDSLDVALAQTTAISDLPEEDDWRTEIVDYSLNVSGGAATLMIFHAAYPSDNPNSIYPVCAAFDEVIPSPTKGTFTVIKQIINDNGGTAEVADYILSVIDSGQNSFVILSGEANEFSPATYTIGESGPSGYVATFSGDCDNEGQITIVAGESLTCTITNNDIPADRGGTEEGGTEEEPPVTHQTPPPDGGGGGSVVYNFGGTTGSALQSPGSGQVDGGLVLGPELPAFLPEVGGVQTLPRTGSSPELLFMILAIGFIALSISRKKQIA